MSEFEIKTATRQSAPVSVYIEGESGAGKTYSALLLARGLAGDGKIGIIDTEGGRSLIYADDPDIGGFEHLSFRPPYSPDRCIAAFKAAVAAGWSALVFDSASLEHDGEGGLIEMAEEEEARLIAKNPNNRAVSQQKWTKPKQAHKRFLNFAVGLPCHVIFCFRQTLTTDFDATDEQGRKKPTTILSTVAEKNTKFVLELHANIRADHSAHWSRIPKPYLPCIRQDAPISVATGRRLSDSSKIGSPKEAQTDPREGYLIDIATYLESEDIDVADFNAAIESAYKGKYRDYEKLPTDHLAKLSTNEGLAKMAEKAREFGRGAA